MLKKQKNNRTKIVKVRLTEDEFSRMKTALKKRTEFMQNEYMETMKRDPSTQMQEKLWEVYRRDYERYMSSGKIPKTNTDAPDVQQVTGR